jgi:hypothetical protein
MGNFNYTCKKFTTRAQCINYICDRLPDWRHCVSSWEILMDPSSLNEYDEFMKFYKMMRPNPVDKCDIVEYEHAVNALKYWAQMRDWSVNIYNRIKRQIKQLHDSQLKSLLNEIRVQREAIFSQIRKDILVAMEGWIATNQITNNHSRIKHREFKLERSVGSCSINTKISPYKVPPIRGKMDDPSTVLGWDWIYAWNAVRQADLVYHVPNNHKTLGGAKLIFSADSFSFIMAGSCVSFGGDHWGGMSNAERNRIERAKPSTEHSTYRFNMELIKY